MRFCKILRFAACLAAAGVLALCLPRLITALAAAGNIVEPAAAPPRPAAIVFGAGLTRRGSASAVLREFPAALAALWQVHVTRPLPILPSEAQ
jgi:vancomycin permeability regulator SanA